MNVKADIETIVDAILKEHGYLLDDRSSEYHRVRLLMCMAGARCIVRTTEALQAAIARGEADRMLAEIVHKYGIQKGT